MIYIEINLRWYIIYFINIKFKMNIIYIKFKNMIYI